MDVNNQNNQTPETPTPVNSQPNIMPPAVSPPPPASPPNMATINMAPPPASPLNKFLLVFLLILMMVFAAVFYLFMSRANSTSSSENQPFVNPVVATGAPLKSPTGSSGSAGAAMNEDEKTQLENIEVGSVDDDLQDIKSDLNQL